MYCGDCGQEIPDGSKFCLHCGWQVPKADPPEPVDPAPQAESRPGILTRLYSLPKWANWVAAGFFMISLSCFLFSLSMLLDSRGSAEQSRPPAEEVTAPTMTSLPQPTIPEATIPVTPLPDTPLPEATLPEKSGEYPRYLGDVAERYGYSLSAIDVADPAQPSVLYEEQEEYRLVAVEIIVGNVSGEKLSVNPLSAVLVDSEGFTYEAALGARDGGQIALVELNEGEKVQGWVSFSIPDDSTPASIKYELDWDARRFLQVGLAKGG